MQPTHTPRFAELGAGRWLLGLVVAVVGMGHGDVATASSEATAGVVRTAPYDKGVAFGSGCPDTCTMSWAADATTGDLHAAAEVKSPPVEQQLLRPTTERYWGGYGIAGVRAAMAAGPGTTTWTARLHVTSATTEKAASKGSAAAHVAALFALRDTSGDFPKVLGWTSKVLEPMANGDIVLQFQASLPASGVYEASLDVWGSASVKNDDVVTSTPELKPPCMISRPYGNGIDDDDGDDYDDTQLCVPPRVWSQTAYGLAEGYAKASIVARVNSFSITAS